MLVIATFLVSYMHHIRSCILFIILFRFQIPTMHKREEKICSNIFCHVNIRSRVTMLYCYILTATSLADASNKKVKPNHAWDTQTKYQLDCTTAIQVSIFLIPISFSNFVHDHSMKLWPYMTCYIWTPSIIHFSRFCENLESFEVSNYK